MWDPQDSEDAIESALDKFEERVMELHNHHQQQLNRKNITHLQNNALRALVNHPIFIRHLFIEQVLLEHLNHK